MRTKIPSDKQSIQKAVRFSPNELKEVFKYKPKSISEAEYLRRGAFLIAAEYKKNPLK